MPRHLIAALIGLATLLWHPLAYPDGERSISILHVNDVYQIGPIEPKAQRGGLARLATLVRETREKNPATLFLFGGDTISPSMESGLFKGQQMIAAWNALGVDAAVFGNHEFDFGPDILRERLAESRFPWLGANVTVRAASPLPNTAASRIFTLHGLKIGVVGLITPDTATLSKPGRTLAFAPLLTTAARESRKLRAQGVRFIIGLTHVSIEEDRALARSGIFDVILGGHEHHMIAEHVGKTPIFKAGSDARDALHLRLRLAPQGEPRVLGLAWDVVPIDRHLAEDPALARLAAGYEQQIEARLGERIGTTTVALDGRESSVRRQESNLGNFVADAMRTATSADIALVNGGALRGDQITASGPLTRRIVRAWLPFENQVVVLAIDGRRLRQTLEYGLNKVADAGLSGAMPHISGMRVTFDARQPPGQRITRLSIADKPVEDTRSYRLATSTYLANGGDGYALLAGLPVVRAAEASPLDVEIVINAILAARDIAPATDGRLDIAK